jgi:hypothetical protein
MSCVSACDCGGGLACYMGQCIRAPFGNVYCCDDASNCPSGSICQDRSGNPSQCGGGGGGGGGGTRCTTACDCPTGQGCRQGQCSQGMRPIYCCDRPSSCPQGATCQSSSGSFSQCSSNPPPPNPPDGGTGGYCGFIPCQTNSTCTQVGCVACGMNGRCR